MKSCPAIFAAILGLAALIPAPACGDGNGNAKDASATVDAPSGGDGGGGGGSDDGGGGGSNDGGGTVGDGGGAGGPGTVACGNDTCDSDTEECCYQASGTSCVNQGDCPGVSATCDGPEDCSGGGGGNPSVCCADIAAGATTCELQNGCDFIVCKVADDCPDDRPMCCTSGLVPSGVCRAQCFGPPMP